MIWSPELLESESVPRIDLTTVVDGVQYVNSGGRQRDKLGLGLTFVGADARRRLRRSSEGVDDLG
jgi:hypothetical protein